MDIIVGSNTGVLKGIDLSWDTCSNLNFSHELDKHFEPVVLCWNVASSSTNECGQFLSAMTNRTLKLYDLKDKTKCRDLFECPEGSGKIKGIDLVNGNIITCVESGEVRVRSMKGKDQNVKLSVGSSVCRMRRSLLNEHLIATGGKENPLKVWDLNAKDIQKPIFVAKNVRHDWLELRVPVWEADFRFMENDDVIATCTGNHYVRLYDRRGECRRPVLQINWSDHPFTTMSVNNHDRQIIVGSTKGFMGAFDLRSPGKLLHVYKGFAGSITALEAHPTLPYVATCSLDRFVRVHHVDTRKLIHKIYCKAPLSVLLLNSKLSIAQSIIKSKNDDGWDEDIADA